VSEDRFRATDEVASWLASRGLRVRPQTLINWRHVGGGPAFHRFGNRVVYAEKDLQTWLQRRLGEPMTSTSDQIEPENVTARDCRRPQRVESTIVGETSRVADERATVGTRSQLKRSP
jgi:hypothetical protein